MLYTYLGFSNVNMFRVTWGSPEKGDFDPAGLDLDSAFLTGSLGCKWTFEGANFRGTFIVTTVRSMKPGLREVTQHWDRVQTHFIPHCFADLDLLTTSSMLPLLGEIWVRAVTVVLVFTEKKNMCRLGKTRGSTTRERGE